VSAAAAIASPADAPLLAVTELSIAFPSAYGPRRVVDRLSYAIAPGRTLGVVGESGCGKTVAALALLRLVPPPGRIVQGSVRIGGADLATLNPEQLQAHRGQRVAMVFQDPAAALNPVQTIGQQVAEVFLLHRRMKPADALFRDPLHPYTRALLATLPRLGSRRDVLPSIQGSVPPAGFAIQGCRFAPRCPLADQDCRAAEPELLPRAGGRAVACFKA
jgi:oligopeptide/dipeptide ABC transporter ATP-binding protein